MMILSTYVGGLLLESREAVNSKTKTHLIIDRLMKQTENIKILLLIYKTT